ncbi:hypothetical protein H6A61_03155 [Bacteroides caecigallinarum]|nr:hypothetical protein [Bacteroides caecigallinarum]
MQKASVKTFGDLQKSSVKRFGDNSKCSERKFGEKVNKPKNIGETAQKIINFVISYPYISVEVCSISGMCKAE